MCELWLRKSKNYYEKMIQSNLRKHQGDDQRRYAVSQMKAYLEINKIRSFKIENNKYNYSDSQHFINHINYI